MGARRYRGVAWLGRKFGLGVNENQAMLSQFLLNLEVSYSRFGSGADGDGEKERSIIEPILERFKTGAGIGHEAENVKWKDAYQVEQLLVTLMPLADVRIELIKYLSEENILSPGARKSYEAEFSAIFPPPATDGDGAPPAPPPEEDTLQRARTLLIRVLNDVQWRYARRYYLRKLTQYYLRKIMWAFFAATLFFTALLVFFSGTQVSNFYAFFFAVSAGLLGASLSMLTGRQEISKIDTLEAMKSATGYGVILVRIGVGGGAACILYFLFEAGIVASDLFPSLDNLGFAPFDAKCTDGDCRGLVLKTPNADLCKLAFWSFTAGFSEKLVPRILTSSSDRLTEKQPSNN